MSVLAPKGFLAGTSPSGIRVSGREDVCVLYSEMPAVAGAVFTRNQMAAPPITQAREAVADASLRAVVVNAGNANACTGASGLEDAHAMAAETASVLGVEPGEVAVASTGVIGVPLDMGLLTPAIKKAAGSLHATGEAAASSIMTTDTFAKMAEVLFEVGDVEYVVGGMAKGAGMIRPDLATMLCFVTTDARLTPAACEAALGAAVKGSFNRISIDGETSTNDMCLLMANGAAGGDLIDVDSPGFDAIAGAIADVCWSLARAIVRDGEGATKFVEITVRGAVNDEEAEAAAMAVADSMLFKCAIFGEDANWGRVVSAVGASRARIDPGAIAVTFAGIEVAKDGVAITFDEAEAAEALAADEITVGVDLGVGDGMATVWTCDLSYDYVRINADYRT